MTPLSVGVIGYGYTGKLHARAFQEHSGARLIAIADARPERLNDLPPGVRPYADYAELIETDVDAVSVCVPTHLHCSVVVDALSSGKHVLVEKPIAVNLEEAHRML